MMVVGGCVVVCCCGGVLLFVSCACVSLVGPLEWWPPLFSSLEVAVCPLLP